MTQRLTMWREERSYRVGKMLAYSGILMAAIATVADFFHSTTAVFATDFVLLFGCAVSIYWIRQPSRPRYYWWPTYFGLWISILPSLWTTGGIRSPFLGVDLAALFVIGAVMEVRNRSLWYLIFSLAHIPALYILELYFNLSQSPPPHPGFTGLISFLTLVAVFLCVRAFVITEAQMAIDIAERERQLREAQSIGQMGSWEWDIQKDHIVWSDELHNIFGIPKEKFDPSFRAYLQRLAPEMRRHIEGTIQRAIETGRDYQLENKMPTPGGDRFVYSRGRIVKDDEGKVVKIIGTSQDITERKHFESELVKARDELEIRVHERTAELQRAKEVAESASQAKMQFLANMSHEIRTPLNSILGFAELLATEKLSEGERENFLDRVRANGTQLLHLIDDILDLSKFEAGRIPIHESEFSLRALIDDVVNSFSPQQKAKSLLVKVDFAPDTPRFIQTDAHRLRQILANLIGNAIKFSDRGEVSIRVRPGVRVDILDTGVGISKEHQALLFQPFSQGDSSVARRFGGTGLGLVLSRRIAETMGGKLELAHSELGHGSHFWFEIPVKVVDQGAQKMESHAKAAPDRVLHKKRILCAEDSPDNAFLISHYIQSTGAEVDIANDGLEALEMLAKNSYDLVLMDMQMPRMDGLEATRRMRERGFRKPIIALTAHALAAEAQRSKQAGCDLHLTKPIDGQELVQTLREVLRC